MKILQRHFILLVHIAFWTVYLMLTLAILNHLLLEWKNMIGIAFVNLSIIIPSVYIFLLYLIPRFWDNKKFKRFFIYTIILIFFSGLVRTIFSKVVIGILNPISNNFMDSKEVFFQFTVGAVFIMLLSLPLRFYDIYRKNMNLQSSLNQHKLEAELRFLKAQVNPHFLFNALNNIYSLSFTKSDLAPNMILKLSDMMSFMLYDCKEELVPLESEIQYLENYIALQLLKKSEKQNISIEVIGDYNGKLLTPMLFIPFFENAIKHGNIGDIQNGYLKSRFIIKSDALLFTIENSIGKNQHHFEKGGIGLENIKERLKLIYPNNHKLTIKQSPKLYSVTLQLNLEFN